jgi:hypothetical protein
MPHLTYACHEGFNARWPPEATEEVKHCVNADECRIGSGERQAPPGRGWSARGGPGSLSRPAYIPSMRPISAT